MQKKLTLIKKSTAMFALLALTIGSFGMTSIGVAHANTVPNWDTTGSYVIDMQYNSADYPHDMSLIQDNSGNLTGHGGSPAGANVYTWVITTGSVIGNAVNITANYTATPDAVTPQTVLNLTGTIAPDGKISGTWSDNYQGGARTGAFSTTDGAAVLLGTLAAQDFGVMDVSNVKGYTAGFGVTGMTLAGATSVVTQLYSGTTLLQTDTAIIPKFNADITGSQFSSPFDVFGTFDYAGDGYWTNVRGGEYGQTLIPTSVVATVTLANGKVVTATNTNLTGDPTTIFPVIGNITTNPATMITSTDATLNGKNGIADASGHSFWVSLAPFVTTSPNLPDGVYSTVDLGAITANTIFSAPLSSATGIPTITTNTKYYFAAWSNVGGTWFPGQILNFTTNEMNNMITVVSPNGGETWVKGTTQNITWQDSGILPTPSPCPSTNCNDVIDPLITHYDIQLTPSYTPCIGQVCPMTASLIHSPYTIAKNVSGTSYAWNVGKVVSILATLADSSNPLNSIAPNGSYTIQICRTGTNVCDSSDAPFNIISETTGTDGTIGGTVQGVGVLKVTSITTVKDTAIADGTFGNGWKYIFNVTLPTTESNLAMKFSDWTLTGGTGTIPVANNMRISSMQADNSDATVLLTASDTYSSPTLHMTSDLSPTTDGIQAQILVETAIPLNSINGAYTTSYGVNTN